MRRPHRRRLLIGVVALTAVGVAVYLLWPTPPPVTWARLQQVPPGTRAEVYQAAGGPPGDYRRHGFVGTPPGRPLWYDYATTETWTCDEGEMHVWFGADGRVRDVVWVQSYDFRPTLGQQIRTRLGF